MVRPLIVAHRGASARHPENTMLAMRDAFVVHPPADGFECDIRLTQDGVPVVFHDADTQRLADVAGSIEQRRLEDVRELRVRGEPVPTLAELVAALPSFGAPGMLVNIEIKATSKAAELVEACRPLLDPLAGAASCVQLVVSSFDPRVLRAAHAAGAPWRLAFLYEDIGALDFLRFFDEATPLDLHPAHRLVDAEHLARWSSKPEYGPAHRAFRAWTVDEPQRASYLFDLGVQAVITNRPNWMGARLAEQPAPHNEEEPP